jgi:hypothetical protein
MTVLYYIILYFIHRVISRNIWFSINTAVRNPNFAYPMDSYTLRTNGNYRFIYKLVRLRKFGKWCKLQSSSRTTLLP